MLQPVRVSHYINCCDLSVFDLQRGRLEFTIGFERDETWQSIDESGTNKFRLMEHCRQVLVELHHGIESKDRLCGRRPLAATVGMNTDIIRQHRAEHLHIAAARSGEKGFSERETALLFQLETRPRTANMFARAGGELAARRRL